MDKNFKKNFLITIYGLILVFLGMLVKFVFQTSSVGFSVSYFGVFVIFYGIILSVPIVFKTNGNKKNRSKNPWE